MDALLSQKNKQPTQTDNVAARASASTVASHTAADISAMPTDVKAAVSETRRSPTGNTENYDFSREDGMYCKVVGRRHTMKGSASAQLRPPDVSDAVEGTEEIITYPRCMGMVPLRTNLEVNVVRDSSHAQQDATTGATAHTVCIPDVFTTEYALLLLRHAAAKIQCNAAAGANFGKCTFSAFQSGFK